MIKIYGIPNCNSVKKAQDFLHKNHVIFEFQDYKKEGLTLIKLRQWFDEIPLEILVNKKGTTFRNFDELTKNALSSKKSSEIIILENTSVIKRPIIEKDGKVIAVGFDEGKYESLDFSE